MAQQYNQKNDDLKVYVNGEILHRKDARISVFDSVVQGGDAVWEGIRVYSGKIFALDKHLDRLMASAKSMKFDNTPTREFVEDAIMMTLVANSMSDGTHIRLTLTRGEKITSGMDPNLNQFGCGLIVLAEFKDPIYPSSGIKLCTASIRRNSPQFLDSKIHHNNLINNILAKIESNLSGCDDAIMLDQNGFVSETNATNIFMVKDGVVYTPNADNCLPGITRGYVFEIASDVGLSLIERNLSITEFYNADEVFTTGSMGELTPVYEIDGRKIGDVNDYKILSKIRESFHQLTRSQGTPIKS